MDDRLIENNFLKGQLGTQQRADFQARDNAVGMRQRNLGRGFTPVDRDIPNLDLHAERNGVEGTDLGSPPGDPFDLGHQTTADQGLKRICGGVNN
jgi:hypothetical protein